MGLFSRRSESYDAVESRLASMRTEAPSSSGWFRGGNSTTRTDNSTVHSDGVVSNPTKYDSYGRRTDTTPDPGKR
ncbi:hypothetical protein AB0940_33500 [Streptomyces sp. NPDC006656]|uniref:hypothetical protein n=1 Tax=Streptomyces sp. NPDC006656 TaxID=3156899 RepID=UPI003456BC04